MDETIKEEIKSSLIKVPGWAQLTAYARAKICCGEIVRRGQNVPNWLAVREIIGKGSGGDIQRGIADSRKEIAASLKAIESVAGVPDEVVSLLHGVWIAAIDCVGKNFTSQVAEWTARLEIAASSLVEVSTERDNAIDAQKRMQEKISSLEELVGALKSQSATEIASREQANKLATFYAEELRAAKESNVDLDAKLKAISVELSDKKQAILALQDENHMLSNALELANSDCKKYSEQLASIQESK